MFQNKQHLNVTEEILETMPVLGLITDNCILVLSSPLNPRKCLRSGRSSFGKGRVLKTEKYSEWICYNEEDNPNSMYFIFICAATKVFSVSLANTLVSQATCSATRGTELAST